MTAATGTGGADRGSFGAEWGQKQTTRAVPYHLPTALHSNVRVFLLTTINITTNTDTTIQAYCTV